MTWIWHDDEVLLYSWSSILFIEWLNNLYRVNLHSLPTFSLLYSFILKKIFIYRLLILIVEISRGFSLSSSIRLSTNSEVFINSRFVHRMNFYKSCSIFLSYFLLASTSCTKGFVPTLEGWGGLGLYSWGAWGKGFEWARANVTKDFTCN